MATVTYVKFMKREDLVKMLTEIHRFSVKDEKGKTITIDNRIDRPAYENFNGITICWRPTAFKLSAFDIDDVLISGEGYVRYNSDRGSRTYTPQGIILMNRYGFERED
jgi:hypothetical protein